MIIDFSNVILYIIFVIITLCSLAIFIKKILIPYKILISDCSLDTLMIILNAAINTELELYDSDVFNNKGSINNANFENFYNDITKNIIKNISPDFYKKISIYITEDAVISIIARRVKSYLVEKIHGTT